MKHFGLFWKTVLLTFTISCLIILFLIGKRFLYMQYRYFESDTYFSETFSEIYYNNGSVGLISKVRGNITTPKLNWISKPDIWDTTTVFSKDKKRGYLNKFSGKITIPARYNHAWKFSEGLGAVVENSRLGFIDEKGQTVIPFRFYYFATTNPKTDFQFKGGYCIAIDSTGKFGLINKSGIWKVKPKYDYINSPIDGYRTILLGNKYGLLDSNLKLILPIEYDYIGIEENGISLSKDGRQQIVSKDLNTIIHSFSFDETAALEYNSGKFDENGEAIFVTSTFIPYRVYLNWGIMDRNGKIITKAIYSEIDALSAELFSCKDGNNWILINSKGEIVRN